MTTLFQNWFNASSWSGAGKDAGELAKAAWDAAISCANKHAVNGSPEDVYKIIWRLLSICDGPYHKKHGKNINILDQGWAWEMVHFIHHTMDKLTADQEVTILKEKYEALEKLLVHLATMQLRPNEHIPQSDRMMLDHLIANLQYAGVKNYEQFKQKADPVFTKCNVCGRELVRQDELKAGVCAVCANEEEL
jgi:hypothetical protein